MKNLTIGTIKYNSFSPSTCNLCWLAARSFFSCSTSALEAASSSSTLYTITYQQKTRRVKKKEKKSREIEISHKIGMILIEWADTATRKNMACTMGEKTSPGCSAAGDWGSGVPGSSEARHYWINWKNGNKKKKNRTQRAAREKYI